MKDKKIVNIIINKIENKGNININLLKSIIKSKILSSKQLDLLYLSLINKIKKDEVIIEYYSDSINKESILKNLDNPYIYKFIRNSKLIGGVRIKKEWSINDISIKSRLDKIKAISLK
jgi:hypothetical protein